MHDDRVFDPDLTEQIRVAVIGYGLAGSVFHAPLIDSTPGMDVTAIVTANPQRRQQATRDYPHAVVFESAEDVFQSAELFDLVAVATPNRYHAPLAQAAMRAGIPVVVDKPMTTSLSEARALIATSRDTGVPCTCFQNRRWDSDFLTLQRVIEGDLVGTVVRFESRFERYRPQVREGAWRETDSFEEGGGLLWDLGSHLIDQALVLFGHPAQVYAEMRNRRPGATVDDDTFLALTFDSGVTAHLWMNVLARIPGPRFRLHGFLGTYEKYGLDPQESDLRDGKRPQQGPWGMEPATNWGHLITDVNGLTVDASIESAPGAYSAFYASVRDALLNGGPMPVDPRDVIQTTRVIEAAYDSARQGRTIDIAEIGD
ncbi:MAG: Gfo/Idh/MocA family oxidoreductase [Chloroflexota bacterium]